MPSRAQVDQARAYVTDLEDRLEALLQDAGASYAVVRSLFGSTSLGRSNTNAAQADFIFALEAARGRLAWIRQLIAGVRADG